MKKFAIIDHVGIKAGMDYYTVSLSRGLASNKASCTVYSNFSFDDAGNTSYRNFFEGHSQANPAVKSFRLLSALLKSAFDARTNNTDLVIMHLFSANLLTLLLLLVPKMLGLKLAIIAHDIASFAENDNALIQAIIYKKLANHIIVHNQYSRECLLQHLQLPDLQKVHVIKHGGYLDFIGTPIEKLAARQQLGLGADKKYLLFFGQIKKVKGLDLLLQAMPDIAPDIHLIIAGKPWKDDFSQYEDMIARLRLQNRVETFIRFITDDERKLFFFAADVNVLPYRVIYQSGVLLMAMSHGLPVIASDLPSNQEIIRHGENGLLFNSEDSASLAKAINMFFADNDSATRLGRTALQTIANEYNWHNIAGAYIQLLNEDTHQ